MSSQATESPQGTAGTTERLFHIAIAVKGVDGGLQLLGAILLIFIKPTFLAQLSEAVLARDLLGAQNGPLAHHFQIATDSFMHGDTRYFAIFYLALHGVIKLGLVWALWKKIRPAYPVGIVVLGAFVAYELYRATQTHSIALPIFAAIDIVIIVLVFREYRQLLREQREASAGAA